MTTQTDGPQSTRGAETRESSPSGQRRGWWALAGIKATLQRHRPAGSVFYIARIEHPYELVVAENIAGYFSRIAIPTREIAMNARPKVRPELAECLTGDALGVVGLNWHLDHSRIDGKRFLTAARQARVPVVQWIVDHPSSRWPLFQRTNARNSRFMFQSPYAEQYFRRFIIPRCRSGTTLGNTGASTRSRVDNLTHETFRARDIRCLLPFNLRRIGGTLEEAEKLLADLPPDFRDAVSEGIARAQNDLDFPIETHFFGGAPPRRLLRTPRLFHLCIRLIEDIVQLRRRIAVLAAAQASPVLIQSDAAGAAYMAPGAAATLERGIGMLETLERMRRARAVVSLSAVNDEIHDRTMNALNAGAVPIVEDNVIHRRFFTHGKNALLFRYDDDSLRACFDLVCSDPERAYRIAEAGRALNDDPHLQHGGFDELLRLVRPASGDETA